MIDHASWFSVLTAEVLFDNALSSDQKILVALISNGMTKKGYCWSSNDYFASALNCHVRTVQRNLEALESAGYISRFINIDPETKEVKERVLMVNERKLSRPLMTLVSPPHDSRVMTPPDTSVMYNNIYSNNKENSSFVEPEGSTPPPPPLKTESSEEEKGEALTNPAPQEKKEPIPQVAPDPLSSKAYNMIVKKQLIENPKTIEDKAHNWNTISGFLKENQGFPYPEPYMDLWNIYAAKRALPQVLTVNATRQRKIATRVQEKPFNFIKILEVMSKSTFLLEQWPASFDWLIDNDNNYVKVLEGNYK